MSTLHKMESLKEQSEEEFSSAIMQSMDGASAYSTDYSFSSCSASQSDVSLHGVGSSQIIDQNNVNYPGFLLIDNNEHLKVQSAEKFLTKLGCQRSQVRVKVVSIFGNTGDGKSHTLNHTFFKGYEVFQTSNSQTSCTLGVWAAYDPQMKAIVLDTEGFLGITNFENARTRLLLKVLAISDIIIYRAKSERLNKDMFVFLASASKAYSQYFNKALQDIALKEGISTAASLGPCVIIFHETQNTVPLQMGENSSPEDDIRSHFADAKLQINAFSSIKYVGIKTTNHQTNFNPLKEYIKLELTNTTVRSPREPQIIYKTLRIFNERFSGKIDSDANAPLLFPEEYFTCSQVCHSCGARCQKSVGHSSSGIPHSSSAKCRYQHQFDNLVSFCITCYQNGSEIEVTSQHLTQNDNWLGLAKYAWMGSVIECPRCGEIYRSRKHWYGNKDPEDCAVRKEIKHVWKMTDAVLAAQNTAQRVVDSVSYISEAVSSVSIQPTKMISEWISDQIAPSYWRPNHDIVYCYNCRVEFKPTDKKHHCRGCGEGFCSDCSSKRKPVHSRNWHEPVRVCDHCFNDRSNEMLHNMVEHDISARRVSEQFVSTLSIVGTVFSYPATLIKETVRPAYWVPDSEITNCCVCSKPFSEKLLLHHCRDCGRGVCQDCSPHCQPVPHRGWSEPVRICDACVKID